MAQVFLGARLQTPEETGGCRTPALHGVAQDGNRV